MIVSFLENKSRTVYYLYFARRKIYILEWYEWCKVRRDREKTDNVTFYIYQIALGTEPDLNLVLVFAQ